VPFNPPELLASDGFEKFLTNAKDEFDYIVVDTAPTILVTDTMLISKFADISLVVLRAGFTDKRLLIYSRDQNKTGKLKNMVYVLNSVEHGIIHDLNYGYGYGYTGNEVELSGKNEVNMMRKIKNYFT
jgi:Mrp family chromosome partitioning ATPase